MTNMASSDDWRILTCEKTPETITHCLHFLRLMQNQLTLPDFKFFHKHIALKLHPSINFAKSNPLKFSCASYRLIPLNHSYNLNLNQLSEIDFKTNTEFKKMASDQSASNDFHASPP